MKCTGDTMECHTPESIPDEVLAYAREHTHCLDVHDLDKRVRALPDIFSMPKTNLDYARALARRLQEKCLAAGRGDLVDKIEFIINDPSYEQKRKAIAEKNDQLKRMYAQKVL
jgi:hypothetical protein